MSIDTMLGLIGTVLGVLGIVTGYILYRKSLRQKLPFYSIISNNLIRDNVSRMSGLKITYKNHKIETLTVSKILFWNNGDETIDISDIVNANPLRVECTSGSKILDATVLDVNNPSSQLCVQVEPKGLYATISFDYLDKKQGAIIQVVHTGKGAKDITVNGDLKGAKLREQSLESRGLLPTMFFILIGFCSLLVLSYLFTQSLGKVWSLVISTAAPIAFLFASAFLWAWSEDKIFLSHYPREFWKFVKHRL